MRRIGRIAAIALLTVALASTGLVAGCQKKSAPVLTPQQLQAGIIGKDHPVDQATASQMGCSCHVEAAKKAGQ